MEDTYFENIANQKRLEDEAIAAGFDLYAQVGIGAAGTRSCIRRSASERNSGWVVFLPRYQGQWPDGWDPKRYLSLLTADGLRIQISPGNPDYKPGRNL